MNGTKLPFFKNNIKSLRAKSPNKKLEIKAAVAG